MLAVIMCETEERVVDKLTSEIKISYGSMILSLNQN